ncbi:sensor histidine kinase [Bacillus sp. UMB0893]|uniref:sensor histidine kinase n=1 Tax=Bacillus sp. UMB0893 TaxID=2066053 RepID=UPI000C77A3FC|nr:sensor histidine kinase [Bacillus sp. UMB0893]PLR67874.1 two-component sensor histidine kinase [Bacillus sp. UMB0893]
MTQIQRKILMMSLIIILIMGAFWTAISYINQKSIYEYNNILERYLLLNNVSSTSQDSLAKLSQYISTPSSSHQQSYENMKNQLIESKEKLNLLENQSNGIALTDYIFMLDSQIEAMDLTIMLYDLDKRQNASDAYDEALQTSKFIDETTLLLFKKELTNQKQFYESMIDVTNHLRSLGLWILGIVFVISIAFSYWFSKGITRSIYLLIQGVKEVAAGNFDHPIKVTSNDEISFLAKTFDKMRENIKELVAEIKEKAKLEKEIKEYQLLLKESELKRLHNQINPHFLFNTLNTLSKKAYLEDAFETSDLISTVANLLRYNLKSVDENVTLRDELDLVKEYLTILKARFSTRISYHFDIQDECLDIQVPAFFLQPIVENAFKYGVEPYEEGGMIFIRVFKREQEIHVSVEDKGAGMSDEVIAQVLTDKPKDSIESKSTGIGLRNVVQRLRLFTNQHDVMEIQPAGEKGTVISIKFPA